MARTQELILGEDKLTIADLQTFATNAFNVFEPIWDEAEQNERIIKNQNWTEEEQKKIEQQGRLPYSMPVRVQKARQISATQRNARTSWRVEPRNVDDELKAELGQIRLKSIEQRSKWKYQEADIFDEGFQIKYGASKVEVVNDGFEDSIVVNKKDYRNIMWDPNSKEYDVNKDALFVVEIEKRYRFELEAEGVDTSGITSGTASVVDGRPVKTFFEADANGNEEYDIITVFNHYHKTKRKTWLVIFPDTMGLIAQLRPDITNTIAGEFKSKKDAERLLRELQTIYILNGLDVPEEAEVIDKLQTKMDFYKYVYSDIIEFEETNLDESPYNIFFSIRFEDEFIAFMDYFKWPQKFYDRMIAQIDYSFGKDVKNVNELDVNALADNMQPETAIEIMNKTGGVITTNGRKAVTPVQSQGINPQWLQVSQFMTQIMEDIGGGRAFQGQQEGTAQSGRAILALQQQGQLFASLLLDNLNRFKEAVGMKCLKMAAMFETAEQTIRIESEDLSPEIREILKREQLFKGRANGVGGFVTINSELNQLSYLQDAEFDLIVTEAPLTDSQKAANFTQMVEAEQADPRLIQSQAWQVEKLRMNPFIKPSQREKIIQELEAIQQAQAAQAEQANKREDMKIENEMAQTAIKAAETRGNIQNDRTKNAISAGKSS